jgi:hypothetical protein
MSFALRLTVLALRSQTKMKDSIAIASIVARLTGKNIRRGGGNVDRRRRSR